MTAEKPQPGMNIQFRVQHALAEGTTRVVDMGDAVEHQHRRRRQPCMAGTKQFAVGACKQLGTVERGGSRHGNRGMKDEVESVATGVLSP